MQLRLFCKHCRAFHSAYDEACRAGTPPAPSHTTGEERLLHERYWVRGHLDVRSIGRVVWGKDTLADDDIVTIKQIPLSNLLPDISTTTTRSETASIDAVLQLLQKLGTFHHTALPDLHETFIEAVSTSQATTDQHLFLVQDYIDGNTLEEYITPEPSSLAQTGSRPLAPGEVFTIGIQLCELLNYLQTQHPEIIVGHLHPSTIMRTSANQIVFIGLYKTYALQKSLELDATGSRMTTGIATRRGYSAPELITRADIPSMEKRTQQASIYSLGVLLHQLCTGYDPSETPFIFAPIRTLQHPALEIFDHLLQRMLHRDPQQRPNTFGEVEASLRQIQCYYTMIKADIPEVISPYEAAIETPQLSIPFLPRL